jgi:hypothetical protein
MRLTLYRISTGRSAQVNLTWDYISTYTACRIRAKLGYAVGMPGDPFLGTDVPIIHLPATMAKIREMTQLPGEPRMDGARPVVYEFGVHRLASRGATVKRKFFTVRLAAAADVGAVAQAIIAHDGTPPAYWNDASIQALLTEWQNGTT